MYTGSMMCFDRRVSASVRPFWPVVDFNAAIWSWKPKSKHRRNVSLLGKRKWPNHGTRVEWEYKSSISWTYLCSGDFKRQALSPFCAWVHICFQRLAAWVSPMFSAARDIIWPARENSIIIGGKESARATAKQCTIKWFHLVPPEYYLTAD